jgi:hypothetical protein
MPVASWNGIWRDGSMAIRGFHPAPAYSIQQLVCGSSIDT